MDSNLQGGINPTMLRRRVRTAGARFFHFHYQFTEKMVLVTSNE